MPEKVNLSEKLALFDERWAPKLVGRVNDQALKLAKLEEGELIVVRRGTDHMPVAEQEVQVLLTQPGNRGQHRRSASPWRPPLNALDSKAAISTLLTSTNRLRRRSIEVPSNRSRLWCGFRPRISDGSFADGGFGEPRFRAQDREQVNGRFRYLG